LKWFVLGAYFIIIPLIIISFKKKLAEPATKKKVGRILTLVFLVVWCALFAGSFLISQNVLKYGRVVQSKVNKYTEQVHRKNYRGAYSLLSQQGRAKLSYKKFVERNENIYNVLGDLKRYELTTPDEASSAPTADESPAESGGPFKLTLPYKGVFAKGDGTLNFTLEIEKSLDGLLNPAGWSILSVDTYSPLLLKKKKKGKRGTS
jgi:hypothetical protein